MADYSTDLPTWGALGSEPPQGYAYQADVSPVDDFDNYTTYNSIEDIKHLVSLTNSRIESDTQDTAPSPETGHIWHDSGSGKLKYYDNTSGGWKTVLSQQALSSLSFSHADLPDVSPDDHHSRYSDSEAGSVISNHVFDEIALSDIDGPNQNRSLGVDDSEGVLFRNGSGNTYPLWSSENVNAGSDISISGGESASGTPVKVAHNTSYNDGSVTTGGATVIDDIEANGSGHVTNVNTENRSIDDWNSANGDINMSGYDINNLGGLGQAANTLNGLDAQVAENTDNIGASNPVSSVNGQTGDVTIDTSDNNTYTDSDALNAVDDDIRFGSRYSGIDGVADQVEQNEDDLNGYELQKNGSDTSGVINFKT